MLKTKIIIGSLFVISLLFFTGCNKPYEIFSRTPLQISDAQDVNRLRYEEVIVDYDKSIDKAVQEGNYTSVCFDYDNFLKKPELKGRYVVTFETLCFNKSMKEDDVFREFDKRDLRPADLRELLAFGAQCRGQELNGVNVVALSAAYISWAKYCGNFMTVTLWQSEDSRDLHSGGGMSGFIPECRFLAVKIERKIN